MSSSYPGGLDSFATNHTTGQTIQAATDNDHADAINKIEAELGTTPSGSYSTIKDRLNGPIFDVKAAYGATGDGSTNDSTAIQAAIDAANTAGGGTVYFPHGTYRCNVTAKPRVRLIGEGAYNTILKAVAGSNNDVIKGLNFATLTGKAKATGDYALGAYEAEIGDLTIDGDKANNTAGYGIRLWGRAWKFSGKLVVRNCKSGGVWTEFTDIDSFADPVQLLEASVNDVSIHNCDGNGWTMRGPHDTVVVKCEIWSCTGWAVRVEQSAGSYNGGAYFHHLNFFLCSNGVYMNGSLFKMHGGAITGDVGTGLEFAAGTGGAEVSGVVVAGHATGIILRGAQHQIDCHLARMTGDALEFDGAIGCRVNVHGEGNNNVFKVTNEAGPNHVTGIFDVAAGKTIKTGSAWNSGGYYFYRGYGGAGNLYEQQFPSTTLKAGGWSPVLPASNGILLADNYAVFAPVQSVDAVNFQLFRDNATEKLTYKDNTGAFIPMESRGLKLPVRVAAPVNVTISSPGATIDGVTMATSDRVLLANQTTPSQNGIYVWNGAASAMTRATDSDTATKVTDSLLVTVDEGTVNRDSIFSLSTNKPITLGTTALRFSRVHPANVVTSHPVGSAYQPTSSKLENLPRDTVPLSNQAALATGTIRVFPMGILRAGDTLSNINFYVGTTASASITNSWAGIARLSDRVILAISATSTATTAANTKKTFTFGSAFTADKDETLVGFVMYQATTVPSLFGINHGHAVIVSETPVVNGTSSTGQTTPPAVGATLGAFTADTEMVYAFCE